MRSERQDPIDAQIDEAARGLVAGEPSPSVRAAIRSRIARPPLSWVPIPARAAAAAAVAIAAGLAASALLGPPADRAAGRPVPQPAARERAVQPPQQVEAAPATGGIGRSVEREPGRAARPAVAAAQEPEPDDSPIPPIAIEPLATEQIAVEATGVLPIEIEPLHVEPLRGAD